MGVIGRPHGVRGLVRVHSYTTEPADLSRYAPLVDETGRAWTLEWRGAGIAALRGADGTMLADRDAASRLTNVKLYVDRAHLPDPGEEVFYLSDLVGLVARDDKGATLGRVAQVHDYGAGASLEVARDGAGSLIVPFTRDCVPVVDVAGGAVVVVAPDEVVVAGEDAAA